MIRHVVEHGHTGILHCSEELVSGGSVTSKPGNGVRPLLLEQLQHLLCGGHGVSHRGRGRRGLCRRSHNSRCCRLLQSFNNVGDAIFSAGLQDADCSIQRHQLARLLLALADDTLQVLDRVVVASFLILQVRDKLFLFRNQGFILVIKETILRCKLFPGAARPSRVASSALNASLTERPACNLFEYLTFTLQAVKLLLCVANQNTYGFRFTFVQSNLSLYCSLRSRYLIVPDRLSFVSESFFSFFCSLYYIEDRVRDADKLLLGLCCVQTLPDIVEVCFNHILISIKDLFLDIFKV